MNKEFEGDAGAPLPDMSARGISLDTVAPALGVQSQRNQPDYLDYDQKGRGVVATMFFNSGLSYLSGIAVGGLYGLRKGVATAPSSKFRVQINSVMNHCGRYGSRTGNSAGVAAVLYSLYEGLGDYMELDRYTGVESVTPALAAGATGFTMFVPASLRVGALAGSIGIGMVGATYAGYTATGQPYGSGGFLFF